MSIVAQRIVGLLIIMSAALVCGAAAAEPPQAKPNFVVILVDDVGYGDIGCFGSKTIATPRLDKLAAEGLRLTSFYNQPVCGPCRMGVMTGCYPARLMRTLWHIPTTEITVAEVLKTAGYATGCVGKWDLSNRRFVDGQVPNDQGFDEYFGTLGANDSGTVMLYRNKEPQGETSDMGSLTRLYTDEAIDFLKRHRSERFFLYLPHTMAHVVIDASPQFRGTSKAGLYGDVIEEIDWNVGRVIDTLGELGLADNTIVLFTSDNGPWLKYGPLAGSAGPLRDGKTTTYEGGVRVPTIVWGPGHIPGGRTNDGIMAGIDLLPTLAKLGGASAPTDRVIDGVDQSALWLGESTKSARNHYLYTGGQRAVREGKWKLHLTGTAQAGALYDLVADLGEQNDVAAENPEVVARLLKLAAAAVEDIGDGGTKIGKNARGDAALHPDLAPKRTPRPKS